MYSRAYLTKTKYNDEDVSIVVGFQPNDDGHAVMLRVVQRPILYYCYYYSVCVCACETLCHPIWAIKDNFKTKWIINNSKRSFPHSSAIGHSSAYSAALTNKAIKHVAFHSDYDFVFLFFRSVHCAIFNFDSFIFVIMIQCQMVFLYIQTDCTRKMIAISVKSWSTYFPNATKQWKKKKNLITLWLCAVRMRSHWIHIGKMENSSR